MDIVLTTDNEYVVNAAVNGYCITYEKSKTKEHYINQNSFYNVDTRSFNTKIGFITNLASNLIAMLSNFDPNSEEYKEIRRRIDLLRFFQGSCIFVHLHRNVFD